MIVDVTPFLTKRGGVFILSDITMPAKLFVAQIVAR